MAMTLTIPGLEGLQPGEAAFVIEYGRDFNGPKAAERSGFDPGASGKLLSRPAVRAAIVHLLQRRQDSSDIDAEWLREELRDNHLLARQDGNLSASNKSLELIGKLAEVDAFAAEKVHVTSGKDIADRLAAGRRRASLQINGEAEEVADSADEAARATEAAPTTSSAREQASSTAPGDIPVPRPRYAPRHPAPEPFGAQPPEPEPEPPPAPSRHRKAPPGATVRPQPPVGADAPASPSFL